MKKGKDQVYWEVVRLRNEERMVSTDIAKSTGVPLATVRKWLKGMSLTAEELREFSATCNRSRPPRRKQTQEERRASRLESSRKWYRNNKSVQVGYVSARKRRIIEWFKDKKLSLKCSRCPESHPACLDFHHSTGVKDQAIATMLAKGASRKKIEAEIKKCEVLCSNCHRKHHWEDRKTKRGVVQLERTQSSGGCHLGSSPSAATNLSSRSSRPTV